MTFTHPHQRNDRMALEMARLVARRLHEKPVLVELGRDRILSLRKRERTLGGDAQNEPVWRETAPCAESPDQYSAAMSTLTIDLSDEIATRLEAASRERHVAPAQLVREFISRSLSISVTSAEEVSAFDAMKDGFGCVDSGLGDLSTTPKHFGSPLF